MSKLLNDLDITERQLVGMMSLSYPGFNRRAARLAEKPEVSGITYTKEFARKARHIVSMEPEPTEHRKNPCKTTVWLSHEERRYLKSRGNIGEYLRGLVQNDMKKEAIISATDDDLALYGIPDGQTVFEY